MDLTCLSYRELQKLAKKHGIRSNQKSLVLIEKLSQLATAERNDETGNHNTENQSAASNSHPVASSANLKEPTPAAVPKTPRGYKPASNHVATPTAVHHMPHNTSSTSIDESKAENMLSNRVEAVVNAVASLKEMRGSNLTDITSFVLTNPKYSKFFQIQVLKHQLQLALKEAVARQKIAIRSKGAGGNGVRYHIPMHYSSARKADPAPGSASKSRLGGTVRRVLTNNRFGSATKLTPQQQRLRNATPRSATRKFGSGKKSNSSKRLGFNTPGKQPPTPARTMPGSAASNTGQESSCSKRRTPSIKHAMMQERLKRRRERSERARLCKSENSMKHIVGRLRRLSTALEPFIPEDEQEEKTTHHHPHVARGLNFEEACTQKPEIEKPPVIARAVSQGDVQPQTRQGLPAHWRIRESRSRPGKFYYYNIETNETSWVVPTN